MSQDGHTSADDAVDRPGYVAGGQSMTPFAMTLVAAASKPTELEARTHAIKNCASVILGLASTMERYVDPIARSRLTQLVDASRRMAQLLAPVARPSEPAEHVRVEDVLRLVIDRLGPQAETCSVELAIHCAGGSVVGDVAELTEAFYNLASNALQASPRNSTVRITTRRSPDGDHEWIVEDTGCGIPSNILPRLGTVGVTTRTEGMGLGLAVAVQVISRHHGVLHVESVRGGGTTMTIWLPASPR
jgi:two-component system, NtrC family, sensor histidine kinase HydH